MAFALEVLIVPVLLLTIVAIVLVTADASFGTAVAGIIGLSIVYFVFVRALRFARREEDEPGDDQDDQD